MSIEQRILRARLAAGYDIRKGSALLALYRPLVIPAGYRWERAA